MVESAGYRPLEPFEGGKSQETPVPPELTLQQTTVHPVGRNIAAG